MSEEDRHWIYPTAAVEDRATRGPTLTKEHVRSWREAGYALVENIVPLGLVERAKAEVLPFFPEAGSPESEDVTDFGSQGEMEFPTASDALNEITLHPRLLEAVAQLLGISVRDCRLTQSEAWTKYGRDTRGGGNLDNQDQRMHVDYPNHTLTHPADWNSPEGVEIILYFDDVTTCGGATELVPRQGPSDPAFEGPLVRTPGLAGLDFVNDREEAEAYLKQAAPDIARWREENLYPRARAAHFTPGTFLLYRHDMWHRGTPLLPGAKRLVQNLTFRRSDCEWISTLHTGWAWAMYRPSKVMVRMLATASVDQRCVLGFPAPGHPYWTRTTLDGVRARLEPWGMDISEYEKTWETNRRKETGDQPALDQLRDENQRLRRENRELRRSQKSPARRG